MEGPVAADSAEDDEYMTMDADKWSEHENTYETGETLSLDFRGKGVAGGREPGPDSTVKTKEELKEENVSTERPLQNTEKNPATERPPTCTLPNRYITIRRPPINAKRGPEIKQRIQIVFFKLTTVCLMLLCILLIGGVIGMNFYYDRLSEIQRKVNRLLEENGALQKQIDMLRYLNSSIYQVSSKEDYNCSTGHDLLILNYEVLKEHMKENSFSLHHKSFPDGDCRIASSWNCTPIFR